ncbi:hypothetical protein AB0H28_20925 [Micromonospora sp. NPDC050980]
MREPLLFLCCHSALPLSARSAHLAAARATTSLPERRYLEVRGARLAA